MDEKVAWTDLTPDEIAKFLEQKHQVKVGKTVANRDEQFKTFES